MKSIFIQIVRGSSGLFGPPQDRCPDQCAPSHALLGCPLGCCRGVSVSGAVAARCRALISLTMAASASRIGALTTDRIISRISSAASRSERNLARSRPDRICCSNASKSKAAISFGSEQNHVCVKLSWYAIECALGNTGAWAASLFTCWGPWAMLACCTNATGFGFLMAAEVSSRASDPLLARPAPASRRQATTSPL
jgi:hypothetical protein